MSVEKLVIHKPNPDVITYLESVLERARTGQIQAVAVVAGKDGNFTSNGWAGVRLNCMAMIGEIESLKVDIMRTYIEQRVEFIER